MRDGHRPARAAWLRRAFPCGRGFGGIGRGRIAGRPPRLRPDVRATLLGPHDDRRLPSVPASSASPRAGSGSGRRYAERRAASRERRAPGARARGDRGRAARRSSSRELGASSELVEARAGAAASAARLETLEEKLPETVRSISQETLDASSRGVPGAGRRARREDAAAAFSSGSATFASSSTRPRHAACEDGGRLTAQLELLSAGTRSLAVALGSTQSRGRWGEIQLERILEFVGMEQGVDYSCQTTEPGAVVPTWSCTFREGRTS